MGLQKEEMFQNPFTTLNTLIIKNSWATRLVSALFFKTLTAHLPFLALF